MTVHEAACCGPTPFTENSCNGFTGTGGGFRPITPLAHPSGIDATCNPGEPEWVPYICTDTPWGTCARQVAAQTPTKILTALRSPRAPAVFSGVHRSVCLVRVCVTEQQLPPSQPQL